jgi:CheY-like chemotaxis protein
MLHLVDEILDLAAAEAGRLQVTMAKVDLEQAIGDCIAMARAECVRLGVRLQEPPPEALRLSLSTDALRLRQVVDNLLSNAIKYNRRGGHVTIDATGPAGADGPVVRIAIGDEGRGMSLEQQAALYQPFNRLGAEHTRTQGSGLGLVISLRLVDAMQGRLQVHSRAGVGSTFSIELPVVAPPATEAETHPATKMRPRADAPGRRLRILLVDDHEDTARAMGRLLQRLGYRITTAHTCTDAVAAFGRDSFDLVISDIGLPDGSGLELMRELRRRREIRGIALSGFGMEEDVRKSKEAGFYEHLTKPINFQKLQAVIRDATGGNS